LMAVPKEQIRIPPKEVYTYADYAALPEGAPYQLIGGRLVMTPAPSAHHQLVSIRLVERLLPFNALRRLGTILYAPVDVYLAETETYQPDIIFISNERRNILEATRVNGAPDLVIEILSPYTAYYDLRVKSRVYARHGVREYWVVDPMERSVELYAAREGRFELVSRVEEEGTVASIVLEGFAVEARELFVDLP